MGRTRKGVKKIERKKEGKKKRSKGKRGERSPDPQFTFLATPLVG